ncbi:MAG: hypothetical protein ACYTGW_08615 [Planctomycetota bacterium]|jgi:hypothetical protein
MKTPRLPTLFVGLALFVPTTLAAQDGDLLVIERKADRAGRDLLLRKLKKVRVTLSFNEASAEEVAQYLSLAAGKGITFIVSSRTVRSSELPPLTLALKKLSLANAMAVISTQTELRYVYRSGVVFIKPKDEVKEFTYLQLYDVRAATMKMPNFRAPKLGLNLGEEGGNFEDEDEDSGTTTSGFDDDKLVDLIRTFVLPESWDSEQASISTMRGVLMVRQTESGHRKVRKLLVKLGAVPPIRYLVRRPGSRPLASRSRRLPQSKAATEPGKKKPAAKKPDGKPPAAKKPTEKAGR